MEKFIIITYVLKSLLILASILGFLSARARVREVADILVKDSQAKRNMWILIITLPVIFIILGELLSYVVLPFNMSIPVIICLLFGMIFGSKNILDKSLGEQKSKLWKFVILYTLFTVIFTFALIFIGARVITKIMFGI